MVLLNMDKRNFPVVKSFICILNKNLAILGKKYKNLPLHGTCRYNILLSVFNQVVIIIIIIIILEFVFVLFLQCPKHW